MATDGADLVAISTLGSFGVWLGNGGGSFAAPVQFPNAVYYGPAVGDLNGDGRPDIATGDRNGTLNVFLNNCGAAPANLGVAVTESADPVNEGDELTYTVTVTNQTAAAAAGVRLTSVLGRRSSTTIPRSRPSRARHHVFCRRHPDHHRHHATPGRCRRSPRTARPRSRSDSVRWPAERSSSRPVSRVTGQKPTRPTTPPAKRRPSPPGRHPRGDETATTAAPGRSGRRSTDSNADSGDRDTIIFNIPGAGVPTITLQSSLGLIDQPVIIDGTTQPTTGGSN